VRRPRAARISEASVTRPLIVLSNDDGVHAEGLTALRRALRDLADVVVMAPEREQSASSHRITLSRPLRHRVIADGVHAVDGTPADCVYIALNLAGLLPRRPDLVVSGINHGFNLAMDVVYSGTVAAAREAALRGFFALAISSDPGADMDRVARDSVPIITRALALRAARTGPLLLNVNHPREAPRGVRATRLGRRDYEDIVEVRTDPRGRSYYWIGGPVTSHDPADGVDTAAVDAGFISVTPLSLELTGNLDLDAAHRVAGPLGESP
jgi:5'-nucleotidase